MRSGLFIFPLLSMTSLQALENEGSQGKYIMEFSEPLFSIHQENLKVFLSGDEMVTKGDGVFELFNVNIKLENELKESSLSAEQAHYNDTKKLMNFRSSVNLVFSTDEDKLKLRTENLSIDLDEELVTSNDFTTLDLNGSHITAKSFKYDLKKEAEFLVQFYEGEFIDKNSLENYGKAKSIKLLKDNTILLQGNASFNQGSLKIMAESIYYDYLEKSVIKSLNAKITNG